MLKSAICTNIYRRMTEVQVFWKFLLKNRIECQFVRNFSVCPTNCDDLKHFTLVEEAVLECIRMY